MSEKDLVSEYNDRYVEFLQSLQEATEDKALRAKMQKQGASEEETRSAIEKQRNKRRFGKDWSEGKQGDEAKAEQAKQTAQRRAFPLRSKKPAPETADKPLTGHQKGGMKRSLKSTQAKRGPGGSKPLPIPEPKKREDSSHLTYNDMLAILLEKGYEVSEGSQNDRRNLRRLVGRNLPSQHLITPAQRRTARQGKDIRGMSPGEIGSSSGETMAVGIVKRQDAPRTPKRERLTSTPRSEREKIQKQEKDT
jgi:hypothetical protein